MSEGDVSLIKDEDVLRRMWQQTEDFSKKKEIRAHMYRLREERLRNLYSPGPTLEGKGCDFTSTQGHVKSFADQSFQSMKSKEVRDAGSPPKEFTYRGQDLKELSNAGWNVESENKTVDDGHTHVKSVHANIEGRYDVDGGHGKFSAVDHHKNAVTEYDDGNTSIKRNQDYSNTSAHEQVSRQTDDGAHFSSTTSSSTSTSKFEQVSSTQDNVPYTINKDYDLISHKSHDNYYNDDVTTKRTTKYNNTEQTSRNNIENGELISIKVDYPNENTKVIVETRSLPDGTRVTSTRREFHSPLVQTSRSEHNSHQVRNESKSTYSTSNKLSHDHMQSQITRSYDDREENIVDSQKRKDVIDFRNNNVSDTFENVEVIQTNKRQLKQVNDYNSVDSDGRRIIRNNDNQKVYYQDIKQETLKNIDNHSDVQEVQNRDEKQKTNKSIYQQNNSENIQHYNVKQTTHKNNDERNDNQKIQYHEVNQTTYHNAEERKDNENIHYHDVKKTTYHSAEERKDSNENIHYHDVKQITNKNTDERNDNKNIQYPDVIQKTNAKHTNDQSPHVTLNQNVDDVIEKNHYQTTYQSDYTQRKISNDLSPSHQAWASTLRSDAPTKPNTRSSSPGGRNYQSSNSSLRSSVSPDKNYRKTPSRGGSPSKVNRSSPTRTYSDKYSSTQSTYSVTESTSNKSTTHDNTQIQSPTRQIYSPERKPRRDTKKRPSVSPEKEPTTTETFNTNSDKNSQREQEDKKCHYEKRPSPDKIFPSQKNIKNQDDSTPHSVIENNSINASRDVEDMSTNYTDGQPGYMKHTARSATAARSNSPTKVLHTKDYSSQSPERKYPSQKNQNTSNTDHQTFSRDVKVANSKEFSNYHTITNRNTESSRKQSPQDKTSSPEINNEKEKSKKDVAKDVHSLENYTNRKSPQRPISPDRKHIRESSPTKDIYDTEKNRSSRTPDKHFKSDVSPIRPPVIKDTNEKKSPKLTTAATDSVKVPENDILTESLSSRITSPQRNTSPSKLTNIDFINIEKTAEEINRETVNRNRKLVTPSTSPTRKPKIVESTSSTGQSSPTTVASGFVYFSSSDVNPNATRLDDQNKDVSKSYEARSPSPTKIPCRSPSPEKKLVKQNLPRKSSLKKPSLDKNQLVQIEKPPTSFLVSPDEDDKSVNKSVDISSPTKNTDTPIKKKPPLERRETYEERCRKILGMTDEESSETEMTSPMLPRKSFSNDSSPSISPCQSPINDFSPKKVKDDNVTNIDEFDRTESIDCVRSRETSPKKNSDDQNHTSETSVADKARSEINKSNLLKHEIDVQKETFVDKDEKPITDGIKNCIQNASKRNDTRTQSSSPDRKKVENNTDTNKICSQTIKQIRNDDSIKNTSIKSSEKTFTRASPEYTTDQKGASTKSPSPDRKTLERTAENKTDDTKEITCQTTKQNNNDTVTSFIKYSKKPIETKSDIPERRPQQSVKSTSTSPDRKFTGKSVHENTDMTKENHSQNIEHISSESNKDISISSSKSPKKYLTKPASPKRNIDRSNSSSPERKFTGCPVSPAFVSGECTPDTKANMTNEFCHQVTKQIDVDKVKHNNDTSNKRTKQSTKSFTPERTTEQTDVVKSTSSSPDRKFTGRSHDMNTGSLTHEISQQSIKQIIINNKSPKYGGDMKIESTERPSTKSSSPERISHKEVDRLTSPDPKHEQKTEDDTIKYFKTKRQDDIKTETAERNDSDINISTIKGSLAKDISSELILSENRTISPIHVKKTLRNAVTNIDTQKVPNKSNIDIKSHNSELIMSEREREVLDRVHSSLRKLSPDRKDNQPKSTDIFSKNPTNEVLKKTNVDLYDEVNTRKTVTEDETDNITKKYINNKIRNTTTSNSSSRTTSPTKNTIISPNSVKTKDGITKPRSVSPKKPISPTETKQPRSPTRRPQSPQVQNTLNNKNKEMITNQQPKSITASIKNERITSDIKKSAISSIKQQSQSKILTAKVFNKTNNEVETKRIATQKAKIVNKKEPDTKVTRTLSEMTMKSPIAKKVSPQRIKSKPEIKITKQITKNLKPNDSPSKLPISKPKSATALNTSTDDYDDVIIDFQQAKSSRECSPDRICPTPVGFSDDIGTLRLPDEVHEPDDEFNKRSHNDIPETESLVDDIVEICENEELFIKHNKVENKSSSVIDNHHLKVNKSFPKYNKKSDYDNSKDTTAQFKDTEIKIHSDFVSENLKPDECLLSVSEKVDKFAKGPNHSKDKSPSRKITEEYDKNTIYQDDYTKLSVNDKAHLFIETAENSKTSKPKSIQRPTRPDLSDVDESLKTDECLLSVSDKVTKFVKTAEQVLSDTYVVEEKEKKIKEQHDMIMKQILKNTDDHLKDAKDDKMKENEQSVVDDDKDKDHKNINIENSPFNKPKSLSTTNEKKTPVKITSLRSSEAVKKAKALFENIASTTTSTSQKPKEPTSKKNTNLSDIGISQKHLQEFTLTERNEEFHIEDRDKIQHTDNLNKEKVDTTILRTECPIKDRSNTPVMKEKSPIAPSITKEESPMSIARSPITRDTSPLSKSVSLNTPRSYGKGESPINRIESAIAEPSIITTSVVTTKKVLSRYPIVDRSDSPTTPVNLKAKTDKQNDNTPGYQRPTKTSQIKEETRNIEEVEVSTRRGSGKFGVDLRRTSVDRSSVSSERRPSSGDHHQPCIEDIYDVNLLEQMLEKVVGYEQRRRIRAQIRVAKKSIENDRVLSTMKSTKQIPNKTTKTRSPERRITNKSPQRQPPKTLSPERQHKPTQQKAVSPDRHNKPSQRPTTSDVHESKEVKPLINGHSKEPVHIKDKETRLKSPEKLTKIIPATKVSRPASPDKKARPLSPSKTATPKLKTNRFSEYASAYMNKVGLNDNDGKADSKVKKSPADAKTKRVEINHTADQREKGTSTKIVTERTPSKDIIEVIQINGKRSPSPGKSKPTDKGHNIINRTEQSTTVCNAELQHNNLQYHDIEFIRRSPDRKSPSPQRITERTQIQRQLSPKRSPSPEKIKLTTKETIIKTVDKIDKKIPQKPVQEEKPSWITNRNLKKVTSETRSFSSKKIETDKPKYRATSPSKAITKPIDVITSSYGPGPLDADGKPLFGIKALRKGATNYQVKGTVIRQEFHSRNGGEPEGTVSVTAYSTEPEDLERLLQVQGEKPSRLHGLAAITTTKKFGGDTGASFSEVQTKEERAAIDQFTHADRRVTESRFESTETFEDRGHNYITEIIDTTSNFDGRGHNNYNQRNIEIIDPDNNKRVTDNDNRVRNLQNSKREKIERRVETGSVKQERRGSDRTMQKVEKKLDDKRTTVRQNSVKSLTEKFIKNANETVKTERSGYPKAGLILRTTSMKDSVSSVSSDSSTHAAADLTRADSEHSLCSVEEVVTRDERGDVTTTTTTTRSGHSRTQDRSFLDSSTKVTGVQDILTRMKNADIVIEEGDTCEDSEARALLNKFLGATVLMAGMQSYVTEKPSGKITIKQESVQTQSSGGGGGKVTSSTTTTTTSVGSRQQPIDIEQCWDERVLKKLLEECTDYESRRRLRTRIRTLMAEQEACATAVTEALAAAGEVVDSADLQEPQHTSERGESLLLPLLQGLLQGGGERLLAGLGTASHDVVADVRRSLQRLRLALAPPADHPQARALLALAERLEDALDVADRLDGCKRKTRRRSRTARHTVGVTREELEEARRMVDRNTLLPDPVNPATPTSSTLSSEPSVDESSTPERKQSVDDHIIYHGAVEARQRPTPVAHNATYESTPKINKDIQVVERRAPAPRRPDFFRHSIADAALQDQPPSPAERWRQENRGGIAALANKFDAKVEKDPIPPVRRALASRPAITTPPKAAEEPKRGTFYRPLPHTYNFAAPALTEDNSKPLNRSSTNNKRLRMKRANTIDIGRSLSNGYRLDNDTDEDSSISRAPLVPEFKPQTENDKKFLAFMKKNDENQRNSNIGQANWNNRFGNIKHAFENKEKEVQSRSSSTSSAKRFWQTSDVNSQGSIHRPRKFSNDSTPEVVKPPWATQRREPLRTAVKQAPTQSCQPPVLLSPTKQTVQKPFVARPIPVNQFSHAPMSAFKPLKKLHSPTNASPNIWSPPSSSLPMAPSKENPVIYPSIQHMNLSDSSPIKYQIDQDKQKRLTEAVTPNLENLYDSQAPTIRYNEYSPTITPTHAQLTPNYPFKTIPSQNNLAAPELVKKIDNSNSYSGPQKIDAQRLQIEFYEKQIREKNRRELLEHPQHKPPPPPASLPFTVVDYTPPNITSSFIPLQQTPDIEKAKAHKVDYLPDVVINENNINFTTSPSMRITPVSPVKTKPTAYHNGEVKVNGHIDEAATEHGSVVTRVMRGPVRGAATITTGVRTRGAADSLRGVLDKLSSPKHEVIAQIEHEEEEVTTVTTTVRRNSSENTFSSSTKTNTKVIESMTRPAPKPVSPFAKFRQLEKQNSTSKPNSPKTPQSPGSPSQPYFKFTDPALQLSAVTIKERLLQWCRDKTRDYENVKLENFSTSWADGLAFCALVHHFLPDTFDYSQLTPDKRRHNFTLAFKIADEKAGVYPLLDVDDMVAMRKPDWKCVFTYVQSIYRRFKDEQ